MLLLKHTQDCLVHPQPAGVSLTKSIAGLTGEDLIGAKAYRVIFAFTSLPLAALALVYFVNHRYSGTPLWNLRGVPGVHATTWLLSFISFYFLYPSTFNILEVPLPEPCSWCYNPALPSPFTTTLPPLPPLLLQIPYLFTSCTAIDVYYLMTDNHVFILLLLSCGMHTANRELVYTGSCA